MYTLETMTLEQALDNLDSVISQRERTKHQEDSKMHEVYKKFTDQLTSYIINKWGNG